jgi:hypothetical protein
MKSVGTKKPANNSCEKNKKFLAHLPTLHPSKTATAVASAYIMAK